MDRSAYEQMAVDQDDHWWFVGRRAVLAHLIDRRAPLPPQGRILEVGCGTGGNLAMLARLGVLDAVEDDDQARAVANALGVVDVRPGRLPEDVELPLDTYHLIALLDVLEHLDDDRGALGALAPALARDGRFLVTVPAMPWLWSSHDELHHHRRRYRRRGLQSTIEASGLRVESIGYFNSLLFPLAVLQRSLERWSAGPPPGAARSAPDRPPGVLNHAFAAVFGAERHLIDRVALPFGLSLYAVAARHVSVDE